jgi:chemotaxis-related protein WspB
MQLLTFTVAGEPYAIESRRVVEVLPLVPARPIPHTPGYVRGVFTYRGSLVPLIDLGRRLDDVALEERLSTRVIVVEYLPPGAAKPARLGLVAENVISIIAAERAETSLPSLELEAAPFLGRILRIDGRTVQVVDVDRLLPADLAAGLFPAPVAERTS